MKSFLEVTHCAEAKQIQLSMFLWVDSPHVPLLQDTGSNCLRLTWNGLLDGPRSAIMDRRTEINAEAVIHRMAWMEI